MLSNSYPAVTELVEQTPLQHLPFLWLDKIPPSKNASSCWRETPVQNQKEKSRLWLHYGSLSHWSRNGLGGEIWDGAPQALNDTDIWWVWWVLSFWELKRLMYWGDWYGIDSRIWPYVRIAQVLRPWRLSRIDPYAGLQGISKIRLAPLQNVCWWRIEGTARGQSWRDVHPVDPSLLRLEVWLVPTYKLRVRGSEGYVVLTDYRI